MQQASSGRTGARTKVDDPVGGADQIEIVLDDDDGGPGAHQAIEDDEQTGDVPGVQTGGRLVEHQELFGERTSTEKPGQLDALRLASGKRGGRLTQRKVAQTNVTHRLKDADGGPVLLRRHLFHLGQQRSHLVNRELIKVGNRKLAIPETRHSGQHLVGEPLPGAGGAGNPGGGQVAHLDLDSAQTTAGGTGPLGPVKGKMGSGEAGLRTVVIADDIGQLGVGSRIGARVEADRLLVDHDRLEPRSIDGAAAHGLVIVQGRDQHILDQTALARAGDAGDSGQAAQGDRNIDVTKISQMGGAHSQEVVGFGTQRRRGNRLPQAKVAAGRRVGLPQTGRSATVKQLSSLGARPWPQIDRLVGYGGGPPVVLDIDDRTCEPAEGGQQAGDVVRVLPDGRLVEDVQHIFETAGHSHGQAHPLGLAARHGGGGAIEGDVTETDGDQGVDATDDFVAQALCRSRQFGVGEKGAELVDRKSEKVRQAHPGPAHGRRLGVHAGFPAALAAFAFAVLTDLVEMLRLERAEPGVAPGADRRAAEGLFDVRAMNLQSLDPEGRGRVNGLASPPGRGAFAQVGDFDLDIMGLGRIEFARATGTAIHKKRIPVELTFKQLEQSSVTAEDAAHEGGDYRYRALLGQTNQAIDDLVLAQNGKNGPAARAVALSKTGVEQPQQRMQTRSGSQYGTGIAVEQILTDGDGRAQAVDRADAGRSQALRRGTEGEDVEEAAIRFVVEGVEDQRGFTRSRDAGDNGQTVAEFSVDIAEIVLGGTLDTDRHKATFVILFAGVLILTIPALLCSVKRKTKGFLRTFR